VVESGGKPYLELTSERADKERPCFVIKQREHLGPKKSLRKRGTWVAQSVKYLLSVQVTIPGSWDQALHQAPCSAGSLLLPLPLSLSVSYE